MQKDTEIMSEAKPEVTNEPEKKKGGSLIGYGILAFVVAVGLGAGFGAVQLMTGTSATAANAGPVVIPGKDKMPKTPFTEHAKEAGIEACSTVFPILGQMLTAGTNYNVQSDWSKTEPNKHGIRSLVGLDIQSPDYKGPAAGLVFAAPTGAASCEGTMVRVVPFTQACNAVARTFPKGTTKRGDLKPSAVYELANNGGQVVLLPAGQGCTVITVGQAALNAN